MNFTDFIFEHSKDLGDKIAVFHKDETISYSELYSLILRIRGKLQSLGLGPGEKIILVSDNSFFFVAAYFGIIASGNVVLPLHHLFGKDNFTYVYENCKIQYLFIQNKYLKKINNIGLKGTIFTDSDFEDLINIFQLDVNEGTPVDVNEKEDLAVIIFTSGSTGNPMGVQLTHYNIEYNTKSIIEYLELDSTGRIMAVLPFSYCFGDSLMHTYLRVCSQVVLNNQFMFPAKVLNEINEKKCTDFAGVPSTYQILLRKSPLKKMKFPTLKIVQQAGGKLSDDLIQELREALPTTKIYVMYGQTEATARLSYLPPEFLISKLGSIGKGIPGTLLEVLNKNDEPVKVGEVGDIVASGGNIMIGYWNDPEETTKVLRNGKLYTGDLATVDEDGFIWVVDREKAIIKSGGFRISPKEIEHHVLKLEEVIEVAVIGIEDELLGEAIKLFIALVESSSLTEKDLIEYCKSKFPRHKVPKEVEIVESLPKNTAGKLDKQALIRLEKTKKTDK